MRLNIKWNHKNIRALFGVCSLSLFVQTQSFSSSELPVADSMVLEAGKAKSSKEKPSEAMMALDREKKEIETPVQVLRNEFNNASPELRPVIQARLAVYEATLEEIATRKAMLALTDSLGATQKTLGELRTEASGEPDPERQRIRTAKALVTETKLLGIQTLIQSKSAEQAWHIAQRALSEALVNQAETAYRIFLAKSRLTPGNTSGVGTFAPLEELRALGKQPAKPSKNKKGKKDQQKPKDIYALLPKIGSPAPKDQLTEATRQELAQVITKLSEALNSYMQFVAAKQEEVNAAKTVYEGFIGVVDRNTGEMVKPGKIAEAAKAEQNAKIAYEKIKTTICAGTTTVVTGEPSGHGINFGFLTLPSHLQSGVDGTGHILSGIFGYRYNNLCKYTYEQVAPDPSASLLTAALAGTTPNTPKPSASTQPDFYRCRLGFSGLLGGDVGRGSFVWGGMGDFQFAHPFLNGKIGLGFDLNLGYLGEFGGTLVKNGMSTPLDNQQYAMLGVGPLFRFNASPSWDISVIFAGAALLAPERNGGSVVLGAVANWNAPKQRSISKKVDCTSL